MLRALVIGVSALVTAWPVLAGECGADFDKAAYGFVIENDYFAGTDQNYTTGLRVSMTNPPVIYPVTDKMRDWFADRVLQADTSKATVDVGAEFAIGQSIYTPASRGASPPPPDEHPYAGYLYLELATFAHRCAPNILGMEEATILDTFNVQLGVVGPASGAEWVQDHFHDLIQDDRLAGWDYQLKNEPALAVSFERKYFIPLVGDVQQGLGVDLVPNVGMTMGNVLIQGSVGATLRLGWSLKSSLGPARVRPAIGGPSVYESDRWLAGYFFIGAGGRAVAHNIFLDGNTFRDGPSVKKRHFVDDVQAGLVVQVQDVIVSFTVVSRGKEFVTQKDRQRFGAISLVWRID